MYRLSKQRVTRFLGSDEARLLGDVRLGVERECLRIGADGRLASTPHPAALGAALTHPHITTDFSEALVELVTPPVAETWEVVQFLCELHQFCFAHLDEELFWPLSMPCPVASGEDIPLADYGKSNVGTMKKVYRRGLGFRYGRVMQTISGVHFNFSLASAVWPHLQVVAEHNGAEQEFISGAYFALLRNFRRWAWLILYLFGASPIVCKSFVAGRKHKLENFGNAGLYRPYATSLRMSDVGYHNKAQAKLNISANSLDEYCAGLMRAIRTPFPDYEAIGHKENGKYRQLSTNILQIANEYYSVMRPKRVAKTGEKPTVALRERGVEYIELRALDICPYSPVGVTQNQLRFLNCFLTLCLLTESPTQSAAEQVEIDANTTVVATRGREPDLKLWRQGERTLLTDWAEELCDEIAVIAEVLDGASDGAHSAALEEQTAAVRDSDATPSARMLREIEERGESYFEFGMRLARAQRDYYRELAPLSEKRHAELTRLAKESHEQQVQIEQTDSISFDEYLRRYFAQS